VDPQGTAAAEVLAGSTAFAASEVVAVSGALGAAQAHAGVVDDVVVVEFPELVEAPAPAPAD